MSASSQPQFQILALDTSSKTTSIALATGIEILESFAQTLDDHRSERLWAEIERLLSAAGQSIDLVDAFAVCVGPGGFTGLRVGIAAAKGFAVAQSKPLIGVSSLEAAAFGGERGSTVCALANAYKGEVYSQLFEFDDAGLPVALNEPMVSTIADAIARGQSAANVIFVGESLDQAMPDVVRRDAVGNLAESIARIAAIRLAAGERTSAENVHACYVRPAEAEVKLRLGLLGSKIRRSLQA